MSKSRGILALLIAVIIILCMITFYLQRQTNNYRIAYNRIDREHATLLKDYEKLYNAYYNYDKKMLASLKFSDEVFWAEDSSCYLLYDDTSAVFAFYKKPRMEGEYYFWPCEGCIAQETSTVGATDFVGAYGIRVDTLTPDEFIFFMAPCEMGSPTVTRKKKNGFEPDGEPISRIVIRE